MDRRTAVLLLTVTLGSLEAKLCLLLLTICVLGSSSFDRTCSCCTHRMCHGWCTVVNMMRMMVVLEAQIPSRELMLVSNRIIVRLVEVIPHLVSTPYNPNRSTMMSSRMMVVISRINRVIPMMIVQVVVLVMELRLLMLLCIRLGMRVLGAIQDMRIHILIVVVRSSSSRGLVIKLDGSLIVKLIQHLVVRGLCVHKVRMLRGHSVDLLLLLRMVLVFVAMQRRMVIERQRSVHTIVIVAVVHYWTRSAIHLVVELDLVLAIVLIRGQLIVNPHRFVPIHVRWSLSLMVLLIVPSGESIQTHRIHGQSCFAVVVSETVQWRHIVNGSCSRRDLRRGWCPHHVG